MRKSYYVRLPDGRFVTSSERTEEMVDLFKAGYSLTEIGLQYGMTRERVRQLVRPLCEKAGHGISIRKAARDQAKAEAAAQRRDAIIRRSRGISAAQWNALRAAGVTDAAWQAYRSQRQNAQRRSVWKLNFAQWWSLWQKSGKWEKRGRHGNQYVLGRIDPSGKYEISNMEIRTQRENAAFFYTSPGVDGWWKKIRERKRQ